MEVQQLWQQIRNDIALLLYRSLKGIAYLLKAYQVALRPCLQRLNTLAHDEECSLAQKHRHDRVAAGLPHEYTKK